MDGARDIIRSLWDSGDHDLTLWLLIAISICFLISILLFIVVLSSRTLHISRKKRREKIQVQLEELIAKLMFGTWTTEKERVTTLTRRLSSNRYRKNVLLEEILHLHRNIGGDFAGIIRKYYVESGLVDVSQAKLKSGAWYKKCKGMQELALMQIITASQQIEVLTRHRHPQVREQAQLAILQLKGFEGLKFLQGYPQVITDWHQMNLISILEKCELPHIPHAAKVLREGNDSAVIFVLRLVAHFQMREYTASLSNCLGHRAKKVRLQAIETIGKMRIGELRDQLLERFYRSDNIEKLQSIHALRNIGTEREIVLLQRQLKHDDFAIRFAAMDALMKISERAELEKEIAGHSELMQIYRHLNDPLLNE